ncbi:fimbrial protein [Ralstonia sp. 24A2]|uniref:fimbrial protein n=1 Tax=Ralstonia sp. 24A2 TaxID=3447364 RepID=UPI003F697F8D
MHKRYPAAIAILLLMTCTKVAAQASCTRAPGRSELVWNINIGNIVVQRDAPVGTVLLDRDLTSAQYNLTLLNCTGTGNGQNSFMALPNARAVTGMAGYYNTSMSQFLNSGVAVRVDYPTGLADRQFTNPATLWQFSPNYFIPGPFRIRLVKTGPITSGTPTPTQWFRWTVPQTGGGTLSVAQGNLTGGSITQVACQPVSTAFNIPMNRTTTMDFHGVGTTAGETPFFIAMMCDAGTRLSVALDGTRVGAPENGTVALTPASTARGVGLQLLYNSNPVTLGQTFSAGITSTGGREQVDFRARYIQTGPIAQAGSANATVSYTFTYN